MYKNITEIKIGHRVRITEIKESYIRIHLLEMGCIEGEFIEIKKTSVFGGPVSIKIGNTTLSLRKKEAEQIIVEI